MTKAEYVMEKIAGIISPEEVAARLMKGRQGTDKALSELNEFMGRAINRSSGMAEAATIANAQATAQIAESQKRLKVIGDVSEALISAYDDAIKKLPKNGGKKLIR